MSEHFFIGIDGGATHCQARIRDIDGNLLGDGVGGPANIHSDFPLAREPLRGHEVSFAPLPGSMCKA